MNHLVWSKVFLGRIKFSYIVSIVLEIRAFLIVLIKI